MTSESSKSPINPFHFLLGLMGFCFTMTVIGYSVMVMREDKPAWMTPTEVTERDAHNQALQSHITKNHPLLTILRQYGWQILLGEVGCIAVFALGAIALDRYRDLKAAKIAPPKTSTAPNQE
jgi:hypothetical protein